MRIQRYVTPYTLCLSTSLAALAAGQPADNRHWYSYKQPGDTWIHRVGQSGSPRFAHRDGGLTIPRPLPR